MIQEGYADTLGILLDLASHPTLWDAFPWRTGEGSPHRELSDIWIRYNPIENFDGDLGRFNSPHVPHWYSVVEELPEARRLSERIAVDYHAILGGVLITKIPPKGTCYPHIDTGWHATYYEKFALQLKGNYEQTFHVENEILKTKDGDLFWFDNAHRHWVENPSNEDRITMVVCLRRH